MSNRVLFLIIAAVLLWLLLRRRSPATTVNMTADGKALLQFCSYSDGTTWWQPVVQGPCPSTYQGFPLIANLPPN